MNQPRRLARATFADALRTGRASSGKSQRELADEVSALGVKMDSSTLHRMEHAQREPKLSEALALSRLLNFELDDLSTALDSLRSTAVFLAEDSHRTIDAVVGLGAAAARHSEAFVNAGTGDPDRARAIAVEVLAQVIYERGAAAPDTGIQDLLAGLSLLRDAAESHLSAHPVGTPLPTRDPLASLIPTETDDGPSSAS